MTREDIGESILPQESITPCSIHQTGEPVTRATYKVCPGCGHAYQTETELVTVFNHEIVDKMNKTLRKGVSPRPHVTAGWAVPYCPMPACGNDL